VVRLLGQSSSPEIEISRSDARRLFISKQRLDGSYKPEPTKKGIVELIRDIGCVQIDPISAVVPSHFLVFWSRLGKYDRGLVGEMYRDRLLFEYWAHQLSILLWEDYPLFLAGMKSYPEENTEWGRRVAKWIRDNKKLEEYIISELRDKGPLPSRNFEDQSERKWVSTGWSNNRNVSRMLQFLFFQGRVMVTERSGNKKVWDLVERCVPPATLKEFSVEEIEYIAVQRALRALGVATAPQIKKHFMRDSYPNLLATLSRLESDSKILRVKIEGKESTKQWYIHRDDLPLLKKIQKGDWKPRTVLLSPFDNLICDRARTLEMFGFDYTIEIYVPQKLRKYGYYVLPVLHGDRLVARIDPTFKRESGQLIINKVFPEPGCRSEEIGAGISAAVSELADFLGASSVSYVKVPSCWKKSLRFNAR
jgi:uncharacterized protein